MDKMTHWGEPSCLLKSTGLNANLSGAPLCTIPEKNVQPDIWTSHGPVKLTHKVNYHKYPGVQFLGCIIVICMIFKETVRN